MKTRIYGNKLEEEDLLCAMELHILDDTYSARANFMHHCDDTCLWARKIDGIVHYSDDDVFSTEIKDATHIVAFLK